MDEMMHIALCDDEKCIHDIVGDLIEEYSKEKKCEVKVIHFFSAKELLESKEEIQILLLDIDMPQMDGIEAAKKLIEKGNICKIIMLTGKKERFKEAFKIGAYRFVTKPVDRYELMEALDEVKKTLLGYNKVQVKFQNGSCWVFQYNIDYVKACGDYVKIYVGKKICESDRALKSWKEELDSRLFIECHKSYIVNLKSVNQVEKNMLILESGEKIPIARRRKNEVLQAFIEYDIKSGNR